MEKLMIILSNVLNYVYKVVIINLFYAIGYKFVSIEEINI